MKIFDFDPSEYRDTFEAQGWVHVRGGIDSEFLGALREFVSTSLGERRVEGAAIGGKKDQALFEFPAETDFPGELFDVIAAMCGLDRGGMTLSERHIKAYTADAPPDPTPHKDRYASQVSVGLSIDIPDASRLLLYPDDQVSVNPHNISAALLENLPAGEHPDVVLKDVAAVEIDDSAGDVVAFRGSAIWHCRRNAAGAVNLYLKMNDFGCDPLGEDPQTAERRRATLAFLEADDDDAVAELVPVLSRRLDFVDRRYLRDRWEERIDARPWDSEPVPLSDWDLRLLRELDGMTNLATVLERLDDGRGRATALSRARELAGREVLDLTTPADA